MTLAPASLKLSVIVAASNDIAALRRCLTSLAGQAESPDTEVIVVSNFGNNTRKDLNAEFPFATCFVLSSSATVPELRSKGIYASRGEIVALVEDYCTIDEHWCAAIKKAHQLPYVIIGGVVENRSPDNPVNWAAYFFDYGRYMLPDQPRLVAFLSGMNVSYKRSILEEVEETFQTGFEEIFVHEELRRRRHELYLAPSAIVYLCKDYEFREILRMYFHLARSFAGRRAPRNSSGKRLFFVVGSFALPILLTARIVARTLQKRRHINKLLLSFPDLLLLIIGWSSGEFVGYILGEGDSGSRWT